MALVDTHSLLLQSSVQTPHKPRPFRPFRFKYSRTGLNVGGPSAQYVPTDGSFRITAGHLKATIIPMQWLVWKYRSFCKVDSNKFGHNQLAGSVASHAF